MSNKNIVAAMSLRPELLLSNMKRSCKHWEQEVSEFWRVKVMEVVFREKGEIHFPR